MKLLADVHLPQTVTDELRQLGHDVLTAQQAGADRLADPDVLTMATMMGRAVVTFNRWDFLPLHKRFPAHAGIIACTEDKDRLRQARAIHVAIKDSSSLTGILLRIKRPSR